MTNTNKGSINKHYLLNELDGFTNFNGDRVTSVRVSDNDNDVLVVRMYVIIEDTNLQHVHERITTEARLNVNTLEFTTKAEGKGSRKYGNKAKFGTKEVIDGVIKYAMDAYKGESADASLMTQIHYHGILKSAGADTAELNSMTYKISNGMGVHAAEAVTEGIIERLVADQEVDAIEVKRIEIERVEGYAEDCFKVTADSFEQASRIISLMAQNAPNDGSYDKTDFTVEWSDGQTYSGRLDLQYRMKNGYDLRDQMRETIPYLAESETQANEFITNYLTVAA